MIKLAIITILLACTLTFTVGAQIYKYTDAQGNVHYTDVKPSNEDNKSQIKTIIPKKESTWKRDAHKKKQAVNKFENFVIVTPTDGANLSSFDGNILVSVNLSQELPSNYKIKFYLDDLPYATIQAKSQVMTAMEPGDHTIYAQMTETNSRKVILTTPKVSFNLKQKSTK